MPLTIASLSEVIANQAAHFRTRFPTRSHDIDSYFGRLSRVNAMAVLGWLKSLRDLSLDIVPGYNNSETAADEWGYAIGVPSNNPAAKFGRNIAQAATGGQGIIRGLAGTPVAAGTQAVDSSGQVIFELAGPVTIGAGGSVTGAFTAVTKGTGGNLAAGNFLRWVTPPANVQAQIELTVGLGGGYGRESRAGLITRYLFRLQNPPRGGTAADFRRWCEGYLDANGVAPGLVRRTYVYPLRGGTGTTHSVITGAGPGRSRIPATTTRDAVVTYTNMVRPPAAQHTVLLPEMPQANGMLLQVSVIPTQDRYRFDWTGGPFPVLNTAGNTITVTGNIAGTELARAVDNGVKPRIQIAMANQVLPLVVRVTAYTNAANSVLTLEQTPTVAPQGGDQVYPGSAVVMPIATRLAAMVDTKGPAKESGYADPYDDWDDTVRLDELIEIARATTDTDGTKMVRAVTDQQINNARTNRQARDLDPLTPPEMLFARGVLVLPG